jgi:hypothetical protein
LDVKLEMVVAFFFCLVFCSFDHSVTFLDTYFTGLLLCSTANLIRWLPC